jgi:hypothetical protein
MCSIGIQYDPWVNQLRVGAALLVFLHLKKRARLSLVE